MDWEQRIVVINRIVRTECEGFDWWDCVSEKVILNYQLVEVEVVLVFATTEYSN